MTPGDETGREVESEGGFRLERQGYFPMRESHPEHGHRGELAIEFQNAGLLGAINEGFLHPMGLTLGVYCKTDPEDRSRATEVTGVYFARTDDPEGFEMSDEARARIRAKLDEAGALDRLRELLR